MKGMDRKQSKVVSKTSTSSAGNFPRAGLTKGTQIGRLSKSLGLLILTSLDWFHSKCNLPVNYSLSWHDIEKRIANIFTGFRKWSPVLEMVRTRKEKKRRVSHRCKVKAISLDSEIAFAGL